MGNGAIIYNRLYPASTYETNAVAGYSADNALLDKPNSLCMTDSGNAQVGLVAGDMPYTWSSHAIAIINHTMEDRNFTFRPHPDWGHAFAFRPESFGNSWIDLPDYAGWGRLDLYSISHTNPWQIGEFYVGTKYNFPIGYQWGGSDGVETSRKKKIINTQVAISGNKVTGNTFELNFKDASLAHLKFFKALLYADNFVFIPDVDEQDECYYGNTLQSQINSVKTRSGYDFSFQFTQVGINE